MAIEKFKFVSPGVQVNEIDDSILPTPSPATSPVVIGNTVKGPAMQPVMVSSLTELEKIFGPVFNGNVGSIDVWRTGMPTSPTLATYAARAFLQNSSPITVIRLAGAEMASEHTGENGWQTDVVHHLFAKSGSVYSLIANIYASDDVAINLTASQESASLNADGTISLFFDGKEKKVSLDAKKQSFIRNVLNTNPAKYITTVPGGVGYFLGETFENSTGSVPSFNQVYLTSSTTNCNFMTRSGSFSAHSAWVVDDMVSGTLNASDANKLFRFEGLNNGAMVSKDIKISIENVRASKNTAVTKYGSFDVVIRKLFETQTATVLERFADVNLDPTSDNYIVRRIGDTYRRWDVESLRYVEEGTYTNRSVHVRVVMAETDIGASSLPHGFIIEGTPSFATGSQPTISLFTGSVTLAQAKNKRFGLLSDIVKNADLVDILSHKPADISLTAETLFHTRKISSSLTTAVYNHTGTTYNDYDILLAESPISGSILGFDLPMYGGFDGKNITYAEPFVNNGLLATGNELTNPAYRAIKQAIDIVAEPEVMDMNILCVPGLQNRGLTDHVLEVCKTRGDSMAIVDLEGDYLYAHDDAEVGKEVKPTSINAVVTALEERQIDNSYGAAYFPAVFVASEAIFMPASVAALGAIGGTEGRQALWFAPAGFNRGGLNAFNSGISVSRTALNLTSADRDRLYNININPIATFPSEGVVIFGQKTLQTTPSALDRVNVRRLVNFIKKEISRASTRILFEPNLEATWNRFRSAVDPFLLAIKNGYGLDDAAVLLDGRTTTADLIDRNTMYCKIYIRPTRAIEYIAIDFVVTNTGAAFTE